MGRSVLVSTRCMYCGFIVFSRGQFASNEGTFSKTFEKGKALFIIFPALYLIYILNLFKFQVLEVLGNRPNHGRKTLVTANYSIINTISIKSNYTLTCYNTFLFGLRMFFYP